MSDITNINHRVEVNAMSNIIKYVHYGKEVFVQADLKGKHKEHCLCWKCGAFNPEDREKNCPIATLLFSCCVLLNIVTPVWECPNFMEE